MATGGPASGRARLVDVAAPGRGVSTATVSLVLRGRPGPSQATADAVRAAAAAARLPPRPHRQPARPTAHAPARRAARREQPVPRRARAGARQRLGRPRPRPRPRHHDAAHRRAPRRRDPARLPLRGPGPARPADERRRPLRARGNLPDGGCRSRRGRRASTGVLAADDQGLEPRRSTTSPRWATGTSRSSTAAREHRPRRRGLPRRDGAARVRLGRRRAARRSRRGRGSAAALQLLSRPAGARPTAVIAFNDRVAIGLRDGLLRSGWACRRRSRWSVTTTARWPGSAPST